MADGNRDEEGGRRIFVSYVREEQATVRSIADALGRSGFVPYFDQKLTGGQRWWDELMVHIERCDVFMPILSDGYLDSRPCKIEAAYAEALDRLFLPVQIAEVSLGLLPPRIAETQWVRYDGTDPMWITDLIRALLSLPPCPPVPTPPPPTPPAPVSYLTTLSERVDAAELARDEQAAVLLDLKTELLTTGSAESHELVRRFRKRVNLYEDIARELDGLLASPPPPSLPEAPPATPPSPGAEAPGSFSAGFRAVAGKIQPTLGPDPRPIAVSDPEGDRVVTVDPLIVASLLLRTAPAAERLSVERAKGLIEAVRHSGDGAATAVVMASALLDSVMAAVRAGTNYAAIRRGLAKGEEVALAALGGASRAVDTAERLREAVAIAIEVPDVATLVASAIDHVGRSGAVTVERSFASGLTLDLVEGMRFDRGFLSSRFVTDGERQEVVFDDVLILLCADPITSVEHLLPVLEHAHAASRPLAVIAEDVEGDALATLVVNCERGTFRSVAIKAPGVGDNRRATLEDLAILTGGRVVGGAGGLALERATLDVLGRARRVIVTGDETTVVEGAGDQADIVRRISEIKRDIDDTDSDYEREKLTERLARLSGGAAVIGVGAADASAAAMVVAVERAVQAAWAILDGGVVAGGGAALARAGRAVAQVDAADAGEAAGIHALATALAAPLRALAANADYPADDVLEQLQASTPGAVFDFRTLHLVDASDAGLVDGLQCLRVGLREAIELAQFAAALIE